MDRCRAEGEYKWIWSISRHWRFLFTWFSKQSQCRPMSGYRDWGEGRKEGSCTTSVCAFEMWVMKDGISPFVGSDRQEENKDWKVFRTYKGTYFWNAQREPDIDYKEKCHSQSIGTEKWPLQHAGCKWRARLHLSKLKKKSCGRNWDRKDESQRERFSCTVGQEGPHHRDVGRLQPFLLTSLLYPGVKTFESDVER